MTRLMILISLVAASAIPSTAALADVNSNGRTIDCFCTDKTGSRVELGEFSCLQVDGRMFTAQCQMSLNVPMWREIRNGCLSSELAPEPLAQSINPSL